MEITHRRSRYQAGSLTTETRKNGPSVYVFRWRETIDGRNVKRKQVLGTTKELTKTRVQKEADSYRQQANTPQPIGANTSLTVAALASHYKEHELGESCGKTAKVVKAYKQVLDSYILPKWGSLPLQMVKAVAVEEWLKSLAKANGTKAKVREVFGATF